ncbi:MAG: biopolymer transporter ExbD [Bdellovibrionota bacterium]|nr:biopolymer transporter ExbD [Bdellovibrionota bacterium]
MARNRSIRNKKRERRSPTNIDITSLLDILVILLVFLLKSYNSSGVVLNVPKGITLPDSKSESMSNAGIMIQVSKDKIYVDDETILDNENPPPKIYGEGGRMIVPLYNQLVKKKEEIKVLAKQVNSAAGIENEDNQKKFTGIANLIIDKSLKYSFVKKIMYTCAAAGFKEYKFVVLGEDQ